MVRMSPPPCSHVANVSDDTARTPLRAPIAEGEFS